jgi:hypothetical protein
LARLARIPAMGASAGFAAFSCGTLYHSDSQRSLAALADDRASAQFSTENRMSQLLTAKRKLLSCLRGHTIGYKLCELAVAHSIWIESELVELVKTFKLGSLPNRGDP